MGKLFAILTVLVTLATAYPIVTHKYAPPAGASANAAEIDRELSRTTLEAGLAFAGAQLLLAFFVWRFSRGKERSDKSLPGGAKLMVACAVIVVGAETISLGLTGQKVWANTYLAAPSSNAMQIQVQAQQFAYYFRYPGPDGKFGMIRPEKIDDGNLNFFGLDPANDMESRDDIVTSQLAVPVNQEILLLMHARDVGHSFYVRELRMQQDFLPGTDLSIHFTPTKIGRYEIVCTQLCGMGHYNMKAYLEVMPRADFDAWLKAKASEQ